MFMGYLHESSDFYSLSSGSEAWGSLSHTEAMVPCHQHRGTAVPNTDRGLWRLASACLPSILPSCLTAERQAPCCSHHSNPRPQQELLLLYTRATLACRSSWDLANLICISHLQYHRISTEWCKENPLLLLHFCIHLAFLSDLKTGP